MTKKLRILFLFSAAFLLVLSSCKTKAVLADGMAKELLSAEKIFKNHRANLDNFTTLYIKSNAQYEDDKQNQNVTAEIKIKKNEMILISIRFLGITMAKAMITPNDVKYYEKINGSYFEGNYTTLSQWLGTDLDFNKVQNILLGQAIYDFKTENFTTTIEDQLYKLVDNSDVNNSKTYYFESDKYLIKKEQIIQTQQERALQIEYSNYTTNQNMAVPSNIRIEAIQTKGRTTISIDYNTVILNEELSFPYSVPEGYERININ